MTSTSRVTSTTRADWLIPAALIALAAIPVIAGVVRLVTLASGPAITPANLRFVSAPLPVVLHILGATTYCVLGAFQFSPGLRRRHLVWHRRAGRALVILGLVAAFSGIWMAMTYAIVPADSTLLHVFRLLAGAGMALGLVLAYLAIRRRDVAHHRAWMARAYALGQGAGTQAVTQLPLLLIFGPPDAFSLALMMGGAWGLNLAVAEWLIRRKPRRAVGSIVPAGVPA